MWAPFRKLFARSKMFSSLLGDVVFETPPLSGQSSHSVFQWRVKQGLDEKSIFISLKVIPDGSIGAEGSPRNYISFDLATAERIKADLDACIRKARELTGWQFRS
jgi:hypothetical protein